MKFQNPILNLEWTEGRTEKPKAICPFNFFKVGGIIIKKKAAMIVNNTNKI